MTPTTTAPTPDHPRLASRSRRGPVLTLPGQLQLDVVIPVFNEQTELEANVLRLEAFLATLYPPGGAGYRVTIADNASTDSTPTIAARLAAASPHIRHVRLEEKGRGRALRQVWLESEAPVLAYMDVDLSTGLDALPALIAPLLSGHSDVAIGSRLAAGAHTVRGPQREFISRCYNLILRGSLGAGFSDAQCGFKAIRADVAQQLLPLVQDNAWFFDTELLVLAEQAGLRVSEVAVDWVDDPHSSVDVAGTAADDLRGVWRVATGLLSGRIPLARVRQELGRDVQADQPRGLWTHLIRFGLIGVASTLAYLLLFLLLRPLGGAQLANLAALLLTAVANTAANRCFTFGVRGRAGVVTHHLQGLGVFFLGWCLTAAAIGLTHAAGLNGAAEVIAVVCANLLTTLLKFVLFRHWVFRERRGDPSPLTEQEATS